MTHERAPEREQSLVGNGSETTSWEVARERLANPEHQRTSWLATTRPDGQPHLMPVIATWIDDAIHLVVGEGTRKGRNLAADGRCVIATTSTTLPSLDIVLEGRAEPLTDDDDVRQHRRCAHEERLAARGQGGQGRRPERPDRRPTAIHDLSVRPVEGVRPPRDVRDGHSSSSQSCRNRPAGSLARASSPVERGASESPESAPTSKPRIALWQAPRSDGSRRREMRDTSGGYPAIEGAH